MTDNDVVLDFMSVADVLAHHDAFTVSPAQFDEALARVRARGVPTYAGPDRSGEDQDYVRAGRRGFYFDDPDNNLMELIEKRAPDTDREVRELAETWAAAEVTGDVEALEGILAEEFRGIGPLGFLLDKPAWLKRFASGLRNEALAFRDLLVLDHAVSAIVVGVPDQHTTFNDIVASGRFRISFVTIRESTRWTIASCDIGRLDARAAGS